MTDDGGWTFEEVRARAEELLKKSGMDDACRSLFSDLTKFPAGRKALERLNSPGANRKRMADMMIQSDDTMFWRLLEELAPKKGK